MRHTAERHRRGKLPAGNPQSQWDISGAGDATIQGFATDISVGQTIGFKVDTDATNYRFDVYRLGYYAGLGARLVAVVQPFAALPQSQPPCVTDGATGLVDCGNWALSTTWGVPVSATSWIYIAKLVREDPEHGRASHIVFVVRDDERLHEATSGPGARNDRRDEQRRRGSGARLQHRGNDGVSREQPIRTLLRTP